MGRYFGTDGFRGEANVTLTAELAFQIGRFLGWYFGSQRQEAGFPSPARIAVGKDTRRSGSMIECSLVGGLTAGGADVYLLHVTTTPSVSHVVVREGFDCGIMISASHNPFYDNGIKLLSSTGEKMDDTVTELLEAYLDHPVPLPAATREYIGQCVDHTAGRERYLKNLIRLGKSMKGMRVGLDCAAGSTREPAKAVFSALGAETFLVDPSPDGCNINQRCGSTHPEALQAFVLRHGLDVGFAYDGDGDRCVCVDEKGNLVTGDHILYLCARYLKEHGSLNPSEVVTTVMSNFALREALKKLDIRSVQTPVGDRFVWERMRAGGAVLGGEQSGHIIFARHAPTGDGILTSLMVTEVILAENQPLSALCGGFSPCPQVLLSLPVAEKEKALADEEVRHAVKEAEKLLCGRGRILLRPSGTEPVIRIMAEAPTDDLCRQCAEALADALRRRGYTS